MRVVRFLAVSLCISAAPALLSAGACAPGGAREAAGAAPDPVAGVQAAGETLCALGFPGAEADLIARELQGRVGPEEAVRLAQGYEARAGRGAGAALLARLYRGPLPPAVRAARLRSLFAGWNWRAAEKLLGGAVEDGAVEPSHAAFLRDRTLREPFLSGRHTLAWRIRGWRREDRADRLFLEAPAGGSGDPFECSTTVGWNGRGFRLEVELFLVPARGRTGAFFFGLTAGAVEDPAAAHLGLLHREGGTELVCGETHGAEGTVPSWRGWWPSGRPLRVIVEYLPAPGEGLEASAGSAEGLLRGWVEDRIRGVRIFTLECTAPPVFDNWPAAVGFPALEAPVSALPGFGLYLDDFLFEN